MIQAANMIIPEFLLAFNTLLDDSFNLSSVVTTFINNFNNNYFYLQEFSYINLMNTEETVTAGSSNLGDLGTTSGANLDPTYINLKLVFYKGHYHVIDTLDATGENLIKNLEGEKPYLIHVRAQYGTYYGLTLGSKENTEITSVIFEKTRYSGQFSDIKFGNASVTSYNIPLQKNENGAIFVIQKKISFK